MITFGLQEWTILLKSGLSGYVNDVVNVSLSCLTSSQTKALYADLRPCDGFTWYLLLFNSLRVQIGLSSGFLSVSHMRNPTYGLRLEIRKWYKSIQRYDILRNGVIIASAKTVKQRIEFKRREMLNVGPIHDILATDQQLWLGCLKSILVYSIKVWYNGGRCKSYQELTIVSLSNLR